MVEHGPLTVAGLHQLTIGSRLASQSPQRHLAHHPALPNKSFKPSPLRGLALCGIVWHNARPLRGPT
jgi:hypothetical protein